MNAQTAFPVVMAGGSGTRSWRLSRQMYPKRFLAPARQNTLLQEAVPRVAALGKDIRVRPGCTVGNEEHRFLPRDQLRQIGQGATPMLLERQARDTAPARTLAAPMALERAGAAIVVITLADDAIPGTAHMTCGARSDLGEDHIVRSEETYGRA